MLLDILRVRFCSCGLVFEHAVSFTEAVHDYGSLP
jgi:hypothetical protein